MPVAVPCFHVYSNASRNPLVTSTTLSIVFFIKLTLVISSYRIHHILHTMAIITYLLPALALASTAIGETTFYSYLLPDEPRLHLNLSCAT